MINWGHPENIWKQLRTSENISGTSENIWHHPEKKCPHRGWLCIKVTTQLIWKYRKTAENIGKHLKSSDNILQNNWGPIIDNLVQLEEDFNSRKTSSENSQKTSENSWEHRKTSKIIWYHPENNWGPIKDDLVQFEEDFNIRTEIWSGPDGYLRPDQFLDHLMVIKISDFKKTSYSSILQQR